MSKEEIKYEIGKVLDHFSDTALQELLTFLKDLDSKENPKIFMTVSITKILSEDKELLFKHEQ